MNCDLCLETGAIHIHTINAPVADLPMQIIDLNNYNLTVCIRCKHLCKGYSQREIFLAYMSAVYEKILMMNEQNTMYFFVARFLTYEGLSEIKRLSKIEPVDIKLVSALYKKLLRNEEKIANLKDQLKAKEEQLILQNSQEMIKQDYLHDSINDSINDIKTLETSQCLTFKTSENNKKRTISNT